MYSANRTNYLGSSVWRSGRVDRRAALRTDDGQGDAGSEPQGDAQRARGALPFPRHLGCVRAEVKASGICPARLPQCVADCLRQMKLRCGAVNFARESPRNGNSDRSEDPAFQLACGLGCRFSDCSGYGAGSTGSSGTLPAVSIAHARYRPRYVLEGRD